MVREKQGRSKEDTGVGRFIFLGLASNAATFVTECCGIEVSDFKPIFQIWSNAAALGYECCGIEGSDFKNFFLGDFECRGIGS